jgi:non-specific serine/threonine protein kinase
MTENGPGRFGELLQRLRAAAGFSQEELGERAGLSQRGISDLERGRRRAPHPATVRRLAEALGLPERDRASLLGAARIQSRTETANHVAADAEVRHNLRLHLTSFVGRVQETADIRRALARTRLLTLVGPGGVGKTRLAVHVAEGELETYGDGIWLVELAPLQDGVLVPQLVANVFNVRENPQEPLITTLVTRLQSLQALLILDNCEHVLAACVDLVHRILRTCPRLTVLATSREVLGLGGETIWRVPPLRIPTPTGGQTAEHVAETEAAALFAERAQAVEPSFAITPRNAAAVAEVCRRLDGLPLAIELAASRIGVLTVKQIGERLATHFGFLSSKDLTAAARQQTLDKTIRWSYDLLTGNEQILFERLSAFTGGWSIEAMEAVAIGDRVDHDDALDQLSRLVDKSLVLADTSPDGPARYRLLEPLRQFAQDRLRERGSAHETHVRHAAFFLGLFERAHETLLTRGGTTTYLSPELDNLRTSLGWFIAQGDVDDAQRLASASALTFYALGYPAEGRRWLEGARALDTEICPQKKSAARAGSGVSSSSSDAGPEQHRLRVRARLLVGIAQLTVNEGDLSVAEEAASHSLELYRGAGPTVESAWPLIYLSRVAQMRGEFAEARRLLEETLAVCRQSRLSGNAPSVLIELAPQTRLAQLDREEGHASEAQVRIEKALKLAKEVGHTGYICFASAILGELYYEQGRWDSARAVWEEGLAWARATYQRHVYLIPILLALGRLAGEQGDRVAGQSFLSQGLLLADEMSRWHLAHALETMVEVAVANGQPECALQLAGAAAAVRESLGTPIWPTERARLDPAVAHARESIPASAAAAAWSRGSTIPPGQCVTLAFDALKYPMS